ncbi:hypothetical protein [Paenibacillus donghaensis]|uniref:Uncharacterized protein n=1 Tax=Paenibacillus donghaensis TaxID=414771 RepID=A0A2Z2KU40_9BACL|nr:hypothetical protein [Paenibacillus donghaensis]ASA23178.1 hypothetical protein B9T62_21640 [Paenibacillus donghaensis]
MSWEPAGFMLFSTIEGVGIFAMMMSFFRLKATDYLWQALFIILLMNLQSYVLRNELDLAYLVPIVNLFLFILLLTTVIRIPIIWSAIISITGYMAFTIIQVSLVLLVFGSIPQAQSSLIYEYSGQTMSGLMCILLAWFSYKFAIGFTFDFERLRLRWEGMFVIGLITLFMLLFSFLLYKDDMRLYIVFFPIALLFLLYYAVRKEKMND